MSGLRSPASISRHELGTRVQQADGAPRPSSASFDNADNRLSPWLHFDPLNANNLGHAAFHPVIGFDCTVQRPFKLCAGCRHRDHVAFADVGSAEHIKRGRMQAGHVNGESRLGFVLGFEACD